MALFLGHTKAAVKMIGAEFKQIAFLFNIATQAVMLGYLIYALIAPIGLWYINTALLVLSLAYLVFTLYTNYASVKKEAKQTVKSIYKWIKRVLKLFPLGIAVYSLFLAPSNLTALSLISPIAITVGWLMDILITILYSILESRLDLLMEGITADLGSIPFVGKYVKEATGKGIGNTANEKLETLQEIAAADEAEWNERLRQKKVEKRSSFANKVKKLFRKSKDK